MDKNLLVSMMMIASTLAVACGDDENANEPASMRFQAQLVGEMNMELLNDTMTGLTWVNDIRGCFAAVTMPGDQCETLVFAGREDWRIPTSAELSELLSSVAAMNMSLNYINSTCAIMTASDGWVFTENSSMPGAMSSAVPGNAGIRCVADMQP
ncbi:MAG: hypothetical protein AAFV29_01115 [Myxococcota bacterium]